MHFKGLKLPTAHLLLACYAALTALTHYEAHFTKVVVVATGHHGSHRVIDHSHDVNVKVLQRVYYKQTSKSRLILNECFTRVPQIDACWM